jgi:GT2 family glycosyltransferase
MFANDSDCDIVYTDYFQVNQASIPIAECKVENLEYIYCGNIFGASFAFKASLAKKIGGYDIDKFLFEDYEFFIRAKNFGATFAKGPILPYFYRIHDLQLTSTHELPRAYRVWRLSLLNKIPKDNKRAIARAAVSLLHVSITSRDYKICFWCTLWLLTVPIKTSRYIIERILYRMKV